MNNIMVNDTAISKCNSASMKRRQIQDASLMGLGAFSFADILLMLFSPETLNAQPDDQQEGPQDSQTDESTIHFVPAACTSVIPENLNDIDVEQAAGTGMSRPIQYVNFADGIIDSGSAVGQSAEKVTEAAIPFLRQPSNLPPDVEAAVQAITAQKAQSFTLQAPGPAQVQQTETALPGIGRPISAEKPDASRHPSVPLNAVRSGNSAQAVYEPALQTELSTATSPGVKDDAQMRHSPDGEPWEALYRSVGEAKLRMGREPPADTDEVMQSVKAEEIAGPAPKPAAQTMEKAEVIQRSYALSEQISTGISERLREGTSEFVIKLRPEKLGEITVKLVEKSGKMTLQIEAARPETAKLINNDLTALREAVKPMQVEVREAVSPAPDASQLGFHQFSMGGQQQFSNNQGFHQGQAVPSAYELTPDIGESEVQVSLSNQGLDRYV